jgi:hypothetical protein
LEHTALGIIRKKPELYCVPLKRAPWWKLVESGAVMVNDESVDLIMDRMPNIKELIEEDGKLKPWYEGKNMHYYIVGGQHTYTACKQIGEKEEVGSDRNKFYMNHKIIPIYSKDEDMLIKVSNALNIQVKDKVVTENFRSQLTNIQAK